MLALDAAVERLRKRSSDPKAVMFGLADDLMVIANALAEISDALTPKPPPHPASCICNQCMPAVKR